MKRDHTVLIEGIVPIRIPATDLPMGGMGIIIPEGTLGAPYAGEVIVKTYGNFFILSRPNSTWDKDKCPFIVEPLKEGTKLTIVVGV